MCTLVATVLVALTATLANGQTSQPEKRPPWEKTPQKIDGRWSVIYVEIDGKKLTDKEFSDVTIKEGLVTCKHNGKQRTWRMEFGPMHMVKCTDITDTATTPDKGQTPPMVAPAFHGVYVASQEYLCFSLNKKGLIEPKIPKGIGVGRASTHRPEATDLEVQAQIPGQPAGGNLRPGNVPYNAELILILRRESK